jgi:hypothetical protein
MKIAVLGSGGREHAIVWKLAQSVPSQNIHTLPGNGGIPNSVAIDISKFDEVKRFCQEQKIELIVVGPEAPLTGLGVGHEGNIPLNIDPLSPGSFSRRRVSWIRSAHFHACLKCSTGNGLISH